MPATKESDPNLVKLSSKSMFECLDNIQKVSDEFQKIEEAKAKKKLIEGGATEEQAEAKMKEEAKANSD